MMLNWSARWLFKILDYEHYEMSYFGVPVGQLVINHADQSANWSLYNEDGADVEVPSGVGYRKWRQWLRDHEAPLEA